jgi:hypothetical protein
MDNHYFQFPLCLLSFGHDFKKRLDGIVALGCVEMGSRQWQEFNPAQRHFRRSHPPRPSVCTCTIDLSKDQELQVVAGCEYLNLCCRNAKAVFDDYDRVIHLVEGFERKHGTDARVRIRKDLVLEVRDNKGMSYAQFAVLAAIYSKIGASKRPVLITRQEIWRRAHGFKSDRVFRSEMNGVPPFFTQRQVRSIIERLHERRFFARVTYGGRQTYYSHRMTDTVLRERVFTAKIQRSLSQQARRRADAALTERIQQERRKLAAPSATEGATDMPP